MTGARRFAELLRDAQSDRRAAKLGIRVDALEPECTRASCRRVAPRLTALLAAAACLFVGGVAAAPAVLRVGTSADYPPFSEAGRGFDVEVAKRLAEDWGVRVEWVRFRWPELGARVAAGAFDVAMSGITWRPERDVAGWMSRAVVTSGPCVVGDPEALRVAVNRGGVLEAWARGRFPKERLSIVDDNRSLASLLAAGKVGAVVSDRFESPHVARAGDPVACETARDRKVYWVAPARASDLGPRLDRWLGDHERDLAALRQRFLGVSEGRDEIAHLVDLLTRRLELMPAVAAWKRAHGEPIADSGREATVVRHAVDEAARHGLAAEPVRRLFELQIGLARVVQERSAAADAPRLDLRTELRPAIGRLGDRTIESLAAVAPIDEGSLSEARLAPLSPLLSRAELAEVREALLAILPVHSAQGYGPESLPGARPAPAAN